MSSLRKNVASQTVVAQLVSKTDGSAVTSGTTTVYVLGDGGTQASGSGTVTHEGQGCWSYVPTQAETNYAHLAFTFVNTSAVNVTVQFHTIGYDPANALTEFADALLKRDWSAVSGEAARSVLNALRFLRNKWSISGTTLTVTKEDDATSAWTAAITTNAVASPVTGADPD
jgi:hypothetical protein